ncbi:MAG: putative DNA-binding domain-containing protein [Bacteroidota bacterium]
MTWDVPPPWLERFQEQFSEALRTPLDRASGTLRATPAAYPTELVASTLPNARTGSAERLAVYNRQYWFRLFTVMQREFPLTAALMGAWVFNGECAAFLCEHPPAGHALTQAGDGFVTFLARRHGHAGMRLPGSTVPGLAVVQAARMDDGFRTVFWSRDVDPNEMALLRGLVARAGGNLRLRPSGRFALISESWPLLALRRQAAAAPPPGPVPLPERLPADRYAVIHRGRAGATVLPLTRLQAALYDALTRTTVADAVDRLEAEAHLTERADFPARVAEWMALSVRLGFWAGAEPC